MWRTEHKRLVAYAACFAVETAIAVDWAYYSTMPLVPPAYIGLLVFFGLLLVGPPINSLRLSERLRGMEARLVEAAVDCTGRAGRSPWESSVRDIPQIRSIVRNLDRLKIAHPGLDSGARTWATYLVRLQGEAGAGELRHARTVWREMQAEQDETG